MSRIQALKPANRHVLIVPHVEKNETNTGVLLPDDYKPEENQYTEATVVDIAPDCDEQFRHLHFSNLGDKRIIVDKRMIQEIILKGKTHYMILENYIIGSYTIPGEN